MFFNHRRSVIWGFILIIWGGLYFLNAFDIIQVNIWSLFFPSMLIMWGLWALTGSSFFSPSWTNRKTSLNLPLKNAKSMQVQLKHRNGRLQLKNRVSAGQLLNGRFSNGVQYDLKRENGSAALGLSGAVASWFSTSRPWSWRGWRSDRSSEFRREHHDRHRSDSRDMWPGMCSSWNWEEGDKQDWEISLTGKAALDLNLDTEDSTADLDLRELDLQKVDIFALSSDIDLRLPAGERSYNLSIKGVVSDFNLALPQAGAARIEVSGNISEIDIDEARFPRNGEYYQSPEYASAINKINITIESDHGRLHVH